MQLDLLGVSNEVPRMNNNTKFLICMIDVFSRYEFVRSLKSKSEEEVLEAFQSIIHEIKEKFGVIPKQIDSDNEAIVTSRSFQEWCKEMKIGQHFSDVGDYKSKGVVEAWNKTIRRLIAKYRTAYKTNRYIDALDQLIGYNHNFHSFLRATPLEAVHTPVYFMQAYSNKFEKNYDNRRINIGDKVRLKSNAKHLIRAVVC
jgi:transposase InsO family protein